ncbi:hypothetical protein D3C71_2016810 [compost metagenome]
MDLAVSLNNFKLLRYSAWASTNKGEASGIVWVSMAWYLSSDSLDNPLRSDEPSVPLSLAISSISWDHFRLNSLNGKYTV